MLSYTRYAKWFLQIRKKLSSFLASFLIMFNLMSYSAIFLLHFRSDNNSTLFFTLFSSRASPSLRSRDGAERKWQKRKNASYRAKFVLLVEQTEIALLLVCCQCIAGCWLTGRVRGSVAIGRRSSKWISRVHKVKKKKLWNATAYHHRRIRVR